jgi:hypothetical protein
MLLLLLVRGTQISHTSPQLSPPSRIRPLPPVHQGGDLVCKDHQIFCWGPPGKNRRICALLASATVRRRSVTHALAGPWTLDPGPWTLDPGPWTLDFEQASFTILLFFLLLCPSEHRSSPLWRFSFGAELSHLPTFPTVPFQFRAYPLLLSFFFAWSSSKSCSATLTLSPRSYPTLLALRFWSLICAIRYYLIALCFIHLFW